MKSWVFFIMFLIKVMVYPVLLFFSTFNDIHKHYCCTCGLYTTTKCSSQKFWFCIHNNSLAKIKALHIENIYIPNIWKKKSPTALKFFLESLSVPPNNWQWMPEPNAVLPLRCSRSSSIWNLVIVNNHRSSGIASDEDIC